MKISNGQIMVFSSSILVIHGERKIIIAANHQEENQKVPVLHRPCQQKNPVVVEVGGKNQKSPNQIHQNFQKNRQNCQKNAKDQHLHLFIHLNTLGIIRLMKLSRKKKIQKTLR